MSFANIIVCYFKNILAEDAEIFFQSSFNEIKFYLKLLGQRYEQVLVASHNISIKLKIYYQIFLVFYFCL